MDLNDIIPLIHSDPGLSAVAKEELLDEDNRERLHALLSGASGAALGLALAKYKKLGRTAQIILSGLGFGAGVLVYKYYTRDKYTSYDEKSKMYEIK